MSIRKQDLENLEKFFFQLCFSMWLVDACQRSSGSFRFGLNPGLASHAKLDNIHPSWHSPFNNAGSRRDSCPSTGNLLPLSSSVAESDLQAAIFKPEVHIHCKKKFSIFLSPAGMSLTKVNYSCPGRVWSVTSRLGTGKSLTFFYSVYVYFFHLLKHIYTAKPQYRKF